MGFRSLRFRALVCSRVFRFKKPRQLVGVHRGSWAVGGGWASRGFRALGLSSGSRVQVFDGL